nr:MAG TPA: hypothetical protein [Caudoviricetes sp.]
MPPKGRPSERLLTTGPHRRRHPLRLRPPAPLQPSGGVPPDHHQVRPHEAHQGRAPLVPPW